MATEYDTARQEFLALFPRRDAFIWKLFGYERWQKAKGPLLDAQIAGVISDEGRGLFRGCYWAHKTPHAVLDIDTNSTYHNSGELAELTAKLAAVGLTAKPYQSSDSGGWHVYLFFDDWADSDEVGQTLKRWLKGLGYEIGSGILEVFPSGNALRLPLQQGFGWLGPDGNLQLNRGEVQEEKAIALFLSDLNTNSCNWGKAKSLIDAQIQQAAAAAGELAPDEEQSATDDGFDDFFRYRLIKENFEKGRKYWLEGLREKDTRHDAIICVEHYLWHGDQAEGIPAHPGRFNDQARARLIRAWLEKKHNGFSGHVSAGNWQTIEADIERAVTWRADGTAQAHEPYALTERAQDVLIARTRQTGRVWTMDDLKKGNDRREKQARQKIRRAAAAMAAAGEQLTRNAIAQRSGCSPNTVSKHQDLWNLLTSGSGDKSRGVWGVSLPPGGSHETIAVLTRILTAPEIDFEKKEKTENPLCPNSDSGNLEDRGLGINGTKSSAKKIAAAVAPLAICLANSQPESTQRQDQALRVAAQVLTPGPLLSGIQAVRQMGAGGISFISAAGAGRPSCYTVSTFSVTEYGIKEKEGTASEACAHSGFVEKSNFGKRIPDTTNYKLLTTGELRYSSDSTDEFSLISKREKTSTDQMNSSSASLERKRPDIWLRGPPWQKAH